MLDMDIKTYLEKTQTTQSAFAKKLGVSQGLIHQWITGRTRVVAERCESIEVATNYLVTREDLRPDLSDLFKPSPKKRRAV